MTITANHTAHPGRASPKVCSSPRGSQSRSRPAITWRRARPPRGPAHRRGTSRRPAARSCIRRLRERRDLALRRRRPRRADPGPRGAAAAPGARAGDRAVVEPRAAAAGVGAARPRRGARLAGLRMGRVRAVVRQVRSNAEHVGDERLLHLVVPRAESRVAEGHARCARPTSSPSRDGRHRHRWQPPPAAGARPLDVRASATDAYRDAVRAAVDEINAGELHKVILSRVVEVTDEVDLTATYLAGRAGQQPRPVVPAQPGRPRGDRLQPRDRRAGLRGRARDEPAARRHPRPVRRPAREREPAGRPLGSPKEVYEHAISVKVGTDELADVCVAGSVEVAGVHGRPRARQRPAPRLQVSGQLRPGTRGLGRLRRRLPRRHRLRRAEGGRLRRDPQARAGGPRPLQRRGADRRPHRRDGRRAGPAQRLPQERPDLAARRCRDRRPVRRPSASSRRRARSSTASPGTWSPATPEAPR